MAGWLLGLTSVMSLISLSTQSNQTAAQVDLQISVTNRDTHKITIEWQVLPASQEHLFGEYKVTADSLAEDSALKITYEGLDAVNPKGRNATINVLKQNSRYNVCVQGSVKEEFATSLNETSVTKCVITSTIQTIHPISLMVLILVLLFFLLCFLVGYVAWKCASRSREEDEEYDKSEMNGNGDIVPLTQIED